MRRSSDEVKVSGGINSYEALQLIFIVLKLTGQIDWSWWAVLAPIWVPVVLVVVFLTVLGLVNFVVYLGKEFAFNRRRTNEIKEHNKEGGGTETPVATRDGD